MSILHTIWQRRRYITGTNWVKTIWFNFVKLPAKQGVKLPVLLSRHVKLKVPRGGGTFRCSFQVWHGVVGL